MFDEAFTKLEIDEIASLLDVLNKKIEGSTFDPLETTILAVEVPFYTGYRFLSVADHATNPPLQRFVFQKNDTQDFTVIDWTYKTIYDLNTTVPIALDDKNVLEYVRFFFAYVKGRHGRFIICESADNVQWKDDPPEEVRKKLNKTMQPLEIKEKRKDGVYAIKAFMMLKDALFNVDIYVEPNGRVTMSDHEILIEDVPVLDSAFGQ
ncbi:MAG: hypothetical protein COB36_07550 [Alphaproteobacteria bacterium]|nr:MAG: hypothetical protein COB36_07550 [Alphaproteobacteria bacterium]